MTKSTPQSIAESACDFLLKNCMIIFGGPIILVTDNVSESFNNVFASLSNFFRTESRAGYPHTPWANGSVETQNEHLGRFFRTSSQQNNIHCSDRAEFYTFAQNT